MNLSEYLTLVSCKSWWQIRWCLDGDDCKTCFGQCDYDGNVTMMTICLWWQCDYDGNVTMMAMWLWWQFACDGSMTMMAMAPYQRPLRPRWWRSSNFKSGKSALDFWADPHTALCRIWELLRVRVIQGKSVDAESTLGSTLFYTGVSSPPTAAIYNRLFVSLPPPTKPSTTHVGSS